MAGRAAEIPAAVCSALQGCRQQGDVGGTTMGG